MLTGLLAVSWALAGEVRYDADGTPGNPVWSSDGKWLAYEVYRDDLGGIDLYVSAVAKNGVAKDGWITSLPGASSRFASTTVAIEPSWHPSGMVLFSGSNAGGLYRIYVFSPGGAAATELLDTTKAPGNLSTPTISPTGNELAWIAGGDVFTWHRKTNIVRQLTSTLDLDAAPAWSADGERIVFERRVGGQGDIVSIDVASGVETVIAATPADEIRPALAGDSVLYFRAQHPGWDIVAAGPGAPAAALAEGVHLPPRAAPAVSPDGRWVAWADGGTSQIGLTSLDGEEQILLETGDPGVGDPVLAVQGDQLLVAYTWGNFDQRKLRIEPISEVTLANARDFGAVTSVGAALAAGSATDAAADGAAELEEPAEADGDGALDAEPAAAAAVGRPIGTPEAERQRSSWFGCLGAAPSAKEGSPPGPRGSPWPIAALLMGLAMGLILAWALRRES